MLLLWVGFGLVRVAHGFGARSKRGGLECVLREFFSSQEFPTWFVVFGLGSDLQKRKEAMASSMIKRCG